eukprot:Hpha_TRINITY_DN15042_c3_g15::TRINITY_DN15042_c3_g15_i1::g.125778::m.125778/K10260/FBXW7, SEL10; F-box and WD-40 domain protein 7
MAWAGTPSSPTHAADTQEFDSGEESDTPRDSPEHGALRRGSGEEYSRLHEALSGSFIQQHDTNQCAHEAVRRIPSATGSRTVSVAWLLETVASQLSRGAALDRCSGPSSRRRGLLIEVPPSASRGVPVVPLLEEVQRLLDGIEIVVPLNWIGTLPREVLMHAFSFLGADDLRRADKVCVDWRRATTNPMNWRNLCVKQWPRFSEACEAALQHGDPREVDGSLRVLSTEDITSWYDPSAPSPVTNLATRMYPERVPRIPADAEELFWRKMHNLKERKENAWLCSRGISETERFPCSTVIAQTNGVHCVQYDRNELMTGSDALNEIGIWDLKGLRLPARQTSVLRGGVKECQNGTLRGHTSAVTCLQFDDERVLSGSLDSTVRLWNRRDRSCVRVLNGHLDKVWCAVFCGNRAVSGSSDKTVRIWDLESGECLASMTDHRTSVSCVRMDDQFVVSGSAGNSIRVWDIGSSAPISTHKLRGHHKGVFCLQFDAAKVVSGSLDNTIRVWDRRDSFRCVQTMGKDKQGGGIISFAYDDTKIVSGGADNLVKVWDMRKWGLVHSLAGHSHWITSLQFDDCKIVTGSRDKTVRLWNVNDLP